MRRFTTYLSMCFVALAITAQNKAEIIVSYDSKSPDKHGRVISNKMTLLASSIEAKYFNDLSLWVDSLKSTPEGKAHYMEIIKKTCLTIDADGVMNWDLRKGPTKKIYTYIYTKPADETLTFYSKFGEELGYYDEPIAEQRWEIVEDSTANVLGYECVMAECDYHGRHWKAWFTPEIAIPYGPWKLRGLPGLILRAEADGDFSFEASGLEASDREISPMYMAGDYQKVDRIKALENAEYYMNNAESILNAQGQKVKIMALDEDGNQIEVPKYDGLKHSIEPDYKMK